MTGVGFHAYRKNNPKRERGRTLQNTLNSVSREAPALADASGYVRGFESGEKAWATTGTVLDAALAICGRDRTMPDDCRCDKNSWHSIRTATVRERPQSSNGSAAYSPRFVATPTIAFDVGASPDRSLNSQCALCARLLRSLGRVTHELCRTASAVAGEGFPRDRQHGHEDDHDDD